MCATPGSVPSCATHSWVPCGPCQPRHACPPRCFCCLWLVAYWQPRLHPYPPPHLAQPGFQRRNGRAGSPPAVSGPRRPVSRACKAPPPDHLPVSSHHQPPSFAGPSSGHPTRPSPAAAAAHSIHLALRRCPACVSGASAAPPAWCCRQHTQKRCHHATQPSLATARAPWWLTRRLMSQPLRAPVHRFLSATPRLPPHVTMRLHAGVLARPHAPGQQGMLRGGSKGARRRRGWRRSGVLHAVAGCLATRLAGEVGQR